MQCSKSQPYSITSSAATCSVGGTVRPSICAVLALMTSSNLLDCKTGRSAGFAPLRMRAGIDACQPIFSESCQQATFRESLNDLVRAAEDDRRNGQA
jgi:hypothetical protein